MGAVRMRVQTADENHNNLYDFSPSSNFLWSKKLVFVKNVFINMTFLTSNHCPLIYNIAFSSEKVLSAFCAFWIWKEICTDQAPFTVQNTSVSGFYCEKTTGDGALNHWRKHYYGLWTCILTRTNSLKHKNLNDGLVSYKHSHFRFTWCLLVDWSCVDYLWIIVIFYQLFGHPFTAEDPWVSKWYNDKYIQIYCD